MSPKKSLLDKKNLKPSKGYPLPASCSLSSLDEFLTDGNASFLRAARAGNLEKVVEYLKGNIDINTSNANGLNALHLAAKEGHVNVVTELLKRGANVNAATKKGNTALHIASLAGQEEVVRVLVQLGANVNVQSQNGFTPLYMAAQENHDSVVSFLLANGANQSLATEDGFTPLAVALQQGHDKVVAVLLENDTKGRVRLPALHIAAKKDDCKAATLLLQSDHNPDVTSKSGFTPLHIAAHYGNENIAKILLSKGADVNYAAKHQITPLHVASKWGKMNMVVLLLENGANIEAATRDGLTPLHCAARSGHDQVVDLLLEKGAPFLAKTKNGLAPLHMASQGDHVDSARILLYHKAPVDDVTVDYLTALHVAAHCGHVKVAKLLLDRKADPNARALNGFTPLHIACKKNRIKVVELLLKHGASIEATTESGLTPLHVASFMGCMNIVIYLIQNGANPDVPTVRGETPLHLAARANQTDIIRILLRNGASVDARAREEQTPLHIAARLGNVDIVSLLLQHGAAVDATTKDMYTALHIAAKEDQEEVASALLDHGASLTATTKKGFTPLHLAAKYGNIKVARLLLQKGAPVDAQGKNGVTPLHVAAHYDHVNVALLLLEKGASPHAMAKNGYTPLHIAAKKNQMDIASTLLEYGAKTNSESKAGFTPLHLSSQEGHADMSLLLIDHKADVNHKANNGLTPLHLCAQDDRVNVATVLVKHGAEIGPQTKAGYTPLHVASHFGQINMVRFLLQHDANVHTTTSHGYTPLHQAAQQGHTLVVNLLLENQASPNVTTMQGQTPLSIAQRLGYISVVETLKVVTETTVTTTTTTVTEEKYKVVAPETMQETFMTDSEDEGGADFDEAAIFGKPTHATHVYLPYVEGQNFQISEEAMLGDQSYRYISADELKSLGDDSLPIDVTKDEKQHDVMQSVKQFGAPMVEEDNLSPQHVTPVESGFVEKFSPDNIDLTRVPVHAGSFSWDDDYYYSFHPKGMLRSSRLKWKTFLVSFMVDARGGAMRGCRHSGVRVIIPPRKASMPMRITCRYLRKEKLIHPPPLMEGEACASRILEMGPVGARFLGPVIIEVPHFASTRGKEREITILRSDTGENWREHTLEASEEAVQEVLNESFEGEELSALEDLNTNRITRILTTDFPQYFAIVTRVRQEVHGVGPEGGMVSSTVVPQVQAIFPEGALTKKIRVGLQAQPIAPELVAKLLGNRVAVSPIVTVEPRRRKFHKPITLTIPVPQAATKGMINQYSGDAPTLRLLCSITGGSSKAQWEDVTGSTPLTFVNDCVSFTTTVSARFWLMDCRQVPEVTRYATELYQEAVYVPFMSKFVIFAKRHDPYEAQLRVFCMTDDKEDKTLESQEHFTEVAKSRDVEVLEGKLQYLEFAGNLVPVTKSGEQLKLTFQAFHENRLPFTVRVKDPHIEPMGRIAFMKEPKTARGEPPQVPICNLNVVLPDIMPSELNAEALEMVTLEKRYDYIQEAGLSKPELIHRADLRLSDIARELDKDWLKLAQQLDVTENDIEQIKAETTYDQSEQALMMLRLWLQKSGSKATGNELEKGLRKINREDIIKNCMFNVELVTDDVEKAVAKVHLDQSGFDVFKEELGSSREASMRRGASLDISYDEQDIMKEAESAAETSSETGSLFERDQLSQALTDDKDACQTDVVGTQSPVNDSTISADKVAYISSSAEQCESSGPSALQVNNLNMQSVPVSRNDNIHVSLETQSVQAFENKINNTTYNKELENVVNGSDNYILKIEQSSKKLHEFWPPDKVPETYHSIVYSMQESSDIKSSPFILDESVSNNSFNKESSLELQQNKKNEIMDPNINLSNIIGDDIENSNAYLNDNMNVSEYDKPIAKEISTNSKPLIDPSEKDALDNEKASEINDLGYCSLDKDINDSSNLMTDNIRHEDSLPSEIVSDKYNLGHEQTPSCDSFDKEVLLENTDLHPYSILHSEQTINDTCDTVLENTYDNSERNSSLKELQKHEEMPSNVPTVSHSMPKSTVVNPAHTEVNILQSDESIVVTENSSQSLDYDDKNTENSSAEDAKIRRPSKTPPPSPADEIDKVYGDIEKVKDVPAAATVTNEVKDAHVRLSGEIEIRPMEGAGEVGGQELLARLTESETWPSGDLDTSQVSVSSLPDDEKSEPTTATVSSAAATTADDRSTAVSETVEKTQDDGCGITTHIIQKTTHMTISVQEKPEEEFDDKKQLIAEEGKLDTDQNLVSDTKQEEKKEDNMVCSVDKSVSEEREQETGDQFQAGENVLRESFETSIGQLAEETAIISVVSGDATVKEIREQSVKTIGEKSKPVESVVSSIDDIVSTSPDHILNLTEIPFAADQSELPMDHPLLSTKTDIKLVEEHVQDRNVEITLEQDEFVHELKTTDLKHEQYIQPIQEFESELIPCAFVNTAFAGAELIDDLEQSASIRARSPYEVIREEQSSKFDQREERSVSEETEDQSSSKINFISRHTDIHRRPILQHIPSEISEEDLVEREITSPTRQEFEVFGEDEIKLSEIAFNETSFQSSQDLIKDEFSEEVDTMHSKKETTTVVNGNIINESIEEICSSPQITRIVTTTVKKTVIKTVSELDASGSGMNGEDAVARKLPPHEIELKSETSEYIAKTDDATTPESDTGIPTSPFEVLSESELSDGEHKSARISMSPTVPKSSTEKSHDSVIMTTRSQSFTDKTISAGISKDFSDSETLNEKSQCEELELQSEGEAVLPAKLSFGIQHTSDDAQKLDVTRVLNGPGEVDYHKEYDYDSEFPQTVSYEDKCIFDDTSCTEPRAHEIRDPEDAKKSRYSSISDDGVDMEINEILRSEQQLEDIIERPVTPEPPKEELSNACTEKLRFDLSLPCATQEDDYAVSDDGDQIVSSPGFSPDDSKTRFAYGIEFEKEILDVPEEAMDIDSDQYSEEKDSSYAYAMRFERDPELDEEDIPCYGDLYTHEEEDEDALENGDKIKVVSKSDKDPEFDILAGRKYFSKNVELDDLSMSSLQEFERLEAEIVSGRKSSIGSLDSLNGKPPVSKSGEHDDVSMSSLTEFERLERECTESEKIDPAMQESITQLSEIEEGHESQASETSQENKSDVGKEEDLSIVEDYSNQLESIDEIMLEAKDQLPFQYLIKKTQIIDKPCEGKAEDQTIEDESLSIDVQSADTKIKDRIHSSTVEVRTIYKTSETGYLDPSGETQDNDFNKNVRDDDLDQDSLHDDQDSLQQMLSLKPDSLTEDIKHEFQDSLREEKFDDADSLLGEIPDEMRDSLLEERHIEDDSLRDMDILPDESSLSLESSIAAVISHDSSKTDDHVKVKDQNGEVHEVTKHSSLGSALESFLTTEKAEVIVSHLPKGDLMLSSTDSLEQSSSAAAFHLETDTAMSSSLNSAITSEDYTMISSTDTLEQEGRITFRYEDIPVDELEVIVRDGRQVIVDSEGNIQAQYDAKHYIGAEDNVNNTLSFSSKDFSTVEHPSTSTVQVHSAVTTVSYIGEPQKFQTHKMFHSAADQGTSDSEYESSHFDPDVEVEEIHTTDEFGNPKVIKKIRRVIQTKTQYSSSSSSQNVEEKLKEFLKEHSAGESAGCGEEEIKEERTIDDKGNVVLIRTVQQQILSEPQVHSRTFRGPDADAHSREFIETFQQLDPSENVCEYEKIDEQGNVVRVTQQVVVKPEMHTVSFSGPDAHKQMEDYMKQWTAVSQSREEYDAARLPHLFHSTHVSSSRKEPQEYLPSEGLGCDATDGRTITKTIVSSLPSECTEQMVVHTTTTRTSVSSFETEDEPPSDSKDQMKQSKQE